MKNEKLENTKEIENAYANLAVEASVEQADEKATRKEAEKQEKEQIQGEQEIQAEVEEEVVTVDATNERECGQLAEIKEILELLREAEQKGFERGREAERSEQSRRLMAEIEETRSIWQNDRLDEMRKERESGEAVGDEFLSKIRPSVWD